MTTQSARLSSQSHFTTMSVNPTRFPLWSYLKQPIGAPGYKLILNPSKFWNKQKIHFIERCFVMSYAPEEHEYET